MNDSDVDAKAPNIQDGQAAAVIDAAITAVMSVDVVTCPISSQRCTKVQTSVVKMNDEVKIFERKSL